MITYNKILTRKIINRERHIHLLDRTTENLQELYRCRFFCAFPQGKKEKAKVRRAIIDAIGACVRVNRISQIRFRNEKYVSLTSVYQGIMHDPRLLWNRHNTLQRIVALIEIRRDVMFRVQWHVQRIMKTTSLVRGMSLHSGHIEIWSLIYAV